MEGRGGEINKKSQLTNRFGLAVKSCFPIVLFERTNVATFLLESTSTTSSHVKPNVSTFPQCSNDYTNPFVSMSSVWTLGSERIDTPREYCNCCCARVDRSAELQNDQKISCWTAPCRLGLSLRKVRELPPLQVVSCQRLSAISERRTRLKHRRLHSLAQW